MKSPAKRIARLGLLTAFALILSLVESVIPPLIAFAPGVKIGLPNAVILITLILFGPVDALAVLVAKCFLAALFSLNPFSLVYSVSGGAMSFIVQYLLYRFVFPKISVFSISLTGAITHNLTQLLVASLIVRTNLFYLLAINLTASVLAGLTIGFIVYFTVKFMPQKVIRS
jgi:heptaprenyl diphosphate synthase